MEKEMGSSSSESALVLQAAQRPASEVAAWRAHNELAQFIDEWATKWERHIPADAMEELENYSPPSA